MDLLNSPGWQVWLYTFLVCGWGILSIRFIQKQMWPLLALSLVMLISHAVMLWRVTRRK